jgi:hypothetical protein
MGDGFDDIDRWYDDLPLDYPEAVVKLVDALREYLRVDVAIAKGLLREGEITQEEFDLGMASNEPFVAALKWLENFEIDPTLDGRLRRRTDG